MNQIRLRPGRKEDAPQCGKICYDAFRSIAERHGYPPDFPSADAAIGVLSSLFENPGFYSVVAERDGGKIVGSNFMDERSRIAGIGPITVDPNEQDGGVGKQLMLDVLSRAEKAKFPGVRLLQTAYHTRSLALYTKLGFVTRETLSVLQGRPVQESIPGSSVREATMKDVKDCNKMCWKVHGVDRGGEVEDSIRSKTGLVVERSGFITGYSTGLGFFGHSVGDTNEDLMAMIGFGREYQGPGIIVPTRNHELLKWCLDHGLRVLEQMTLMTIGLYNEPSGSYLPSILF